MSHHQAGFLYALTPDVRLEGGESGFYLVTPTTRHWMEGDEHDLEALGLLTGEGVPEPDVRDVLAADDAGDPEARCASLLYRLDHQGVLVRRLAWGGAPLATVTPFRRPAGPLPSAPPTGVLRISPLSTSRFVRGGIRLETPGAWATVTIHGRGPGGLLHDLAVGSEAALLTATVPDCPPEVTEVLLAILAWCGVLDTGEERPWAIHDILFHTRTRRGYSRVPVGKVYPEGGTRPDTVGDDGSGSRGIRFLRRPDMPRLLAEDPPFARVSKSRRSVRAYAADPLTVDQLSEFLYRTLAEHDGRRPHPSAGALYPLRAYLAVHCCLGLESGIYAYDAQRHALLHAASDGPGLRELLSGAATTADMPDFPQVLVVLAARYERAWRVYGDLGYSLILKEVGVVLHGAMMAAAAMGLGTCPLGTGDSILFGEITGLDPRSEVSVGEFVLGTPEEAPNQARTFI